MSVASRSRDLIAQQDRYRKIRALMDGAESARELIAQLPGMRARDFAAYKARASYLPALPRTVEMFGGLVFFEDPTIEAPESMADYLADATLDGMSFRRLAEQVVSEIVQASRVAVLVDHPTLPRQGMTRAEAEAAGLRAYARVYGSEDILGHTYSRVGGARVLSRVRLAETREIDAPTRDDPFGVRVEQVVRVLELVEGRYQQRVFVWDEGRGKYVQDGPEIVPVRNGRQLPYIPFYGFSHRNHDLEALKPPLADLADVSVDHLNTSALYEWGCMWTANPTPVFIGLQKRVDADGNPEPGQELALGSSEAIILPPGGDAKFLEFTGQGLSELRQSKEDKRRDMGNIGARMLIDDPRVAIAADTVRIQRAGENSMLGAIAGVASEGLTAVLAELAEWAGADPRACLVELNRDFLPQELTPEQITALIMAAQQGALSGEDLFTKLQRGGAIRRGVTYAEHQEEVERDALAGGLDNSRRGANGAQERDAA